MAIAIGYSVGDTVYVAYPFPDSLYHTPQERVVTQVKVTATDDYALVSFQSGNDVIDSDTTQTVYTTEALAATAIIDDVISRTAATVVLEGGADTTLVRTT